MADYFTHFSCLIDVGTPDKAGRALALFQDLRAADQDADDPEVAGFDLVRQDAPEGNTLWIHDDDHGDVEAVIRFVLRLAEALDLTGLWGFEYALTCFRAPPRRFRRRCAFHRSRRAQIHRLDQHARMVGRGAERRGRRCLSSSALPFTSSPSSRMPPRRRPATGIATSDPHDDWWDAVYEDFERVCEILDIRLKTTPVRLISGGRWAKPCIWFSGFWSQGDGASFEGYWSHAKGTAAHIRDYASNDTTLHGIADRLKAIQRRNFYQLAAEVSHRGRYYHEYTMSVDVTRDSPTWQPPTEDAEDVGTEALRDLARWLYRQLEAEYDHLTSDEAIEEGIIANAYTFTEGGRRFG